MLPTPTRRLSLAGGLRVVIALAALAAALGAAPPPPTLALGTGPALTVEVGAGRHPIDPDIYGMNFASEALAAELDLPVRRWGGNATTRYNWQTDTSNHASDWYFQNIPNDNSHPAALPDGSSSDRFVEQDRRTGTASLITVPLIGWTPAGRTRACGFSVAKYGPQADRAWDNLDCGNGVGADGTTLVTGNDPLDTSLPITTAFVTDWIDHFIGRYGTAAAGGVRFYNLDNEPMLWNSTHRDVHPAPTSYDELRDRTWAYAAAVKAADPAAKTLGPAEWGWVGYFYSALDVAAGGAWWDTRPDRRVHGDLPFVEWYLQQMQAYETAHGVRLLDYLDLHVYPQASGVFADAAGSNAVQQLRLRSTRSLWDPTYVDESWIGEPVYLIRRMRAWVAANYPGTRLAIGEYSWGANGSLNGALAEADILGIIGREGLDLAALWGPPDASQPVAYAFRLYRNYDGQHHRFGDTSVLAGSADSDQLAVFAAQRNGDGALTILVINKSLTEALTSQVCLAGYQPAPLAGVYRYSAADLNAIVPQPDQIVAPGGFSATFPASSVTLFVLTPGTPLTPRVYLPLVRVP